VTLEAVDVWFEDEARIGQQGTLTRVWAKKGSRPRIARQQQYLSTYLFGAVCAAKGDSFGLVLPASNTGTMQLFLNKLSEKIVIGRHAVVVVDRAGWHTTSKLKMPSNISILPLPAYSPELNPMEQVWQQLRQGWLANRCYANYEEIVDASCEAWNGFMSKVNAVKNLCTRAWATCVAA
jgi:transposase